jgi:glutamate--cysteine ligase catalytic subunit
LEIQLSDFDNAAFAVFMSLLRQAVANFDLNFYIPTGKVAENMERAHVRNAAAEQTFFFRKNVYSSGPNSKIPTKTEDEYRLMTVNGIINDSSNKETAGNEPSFPGLLPIIQSFIVEILGVESKTKSQLDKYLDVIRARATGELLTPASWMRQYVVAHTEYTQDSVVS